MNRRQMHSQTDAVLLRVVEAHARVTRHKHVCRRGVGGGRSTRFCAGIRCRTRSRLRCRRIRCGRRRRIHIAREAHRGISGRCFVRPQPDAAAAKVGQLHVVQHRHSVHIDTVRIARSLNAHSVLRGVRQRDGGTVLLRPAVVHRVQYHFVVIRGEPQIIHLSLAVRRRALSGSEHHSGVVSRGDFESDTQFESVAVIVLVGSESIRRAQPHDVAARGVGIFHRALIAVDAPVAFDCAPRTARALSRAQEVRRRSCRLSRRRRRGRHDGIAFSSSFNSKREQR